MPQTLTTTTMEIDGQDVKVDGVVGYYSEIYGRDADGNRGLGELFIDDVRDISVYDMDDNEITETLTPIQLQWAAESLADKFLNGGM